MVWGAYPTLPIGRPSIPSPSNCRAVPQPINFWCLSSQHLALCQVVLRIVPPIVTIWEWSSNAKEFRMVAGAKLTRERKLTASPSGVRLLLARLRHGSEHEDERAHGHGCER